jgi:hypothetical protein
MPVIAKSPMHSTTFGELSLQFLQSHVFGKFDVSENPFCAKNAISRKTETFARDFSPSGDIVCSNQPETVTNTHKNKASEPS